MNPDRYSPNLEKRYQTARADYGTELPQRWPMGCVGAPTAFLVLLGPSMGGNRSGEPVAMGGVDRAPWRHNDYRQGRSNLSLTTPNGLEAPLCRDLGNESYVPAMTSLMNLDWQHSTEERKIPPQYLVLGFKDCVWPLLNCVRPRIICVLINRVWDTIIRQIEECHSSPFQAPLSLADLTGKLPSRRPLIFRLPS
jgi:hypothetical protein